MNATRLLAALLLLATGVADADELQFVISGKSFHLGGENLNEDNYGFGLQYDFVRDREWIPVLAAARFKDSNGNDSRYVGAGLKRRFRPLASAADMNLDVGVIGLAMRRPGYNDDRAFFGAVPFVSISNDWGGINLTYVPRVEQEAYPFWYLQFSLKILEI